MVEIFLNEKLRERWLNGRIRAEWPKSGFFLRARQNNLAGSEAGKERAGMMASRYSA
jgi:hypothetical protein